MLFLFIQLHYVKHINRITRDYVLGGKTKKAFLFIKCNCVTFSAPPHGSVKERIQGGKLEHLINKFAVNYQLGV